MGDPIALSTGLAVEDAGIYQSSCSCRTAMTLLAGQVLPRCLGCDEIVGWRLVQRVRATAAAPPPKPSSTRLRAARRRRFDSASGDE